MKQLEVIENRIFKFDELLSQVSDWRFQQEKIVFTNGCFDILHAGHIDYLSKAKDLGQRLIVGINSDASVKSLGKGSSRPIQNSESRLLLVAALNFVDAVIEFNEETPFELIQAIKPDVLTKGGDYDPEESNPEEKTYIVGSDIVRQNGGIIVSIPFLPGYSTSSIENKIITLSKGGKN